MIEAFIEALDFATLGFAGVAPAATGRPSYHPAVLLRFYIYGHLNKVQSSRRLEREAVDVFPFFSFSQNVSFRVL